MKRKFLLLVCAVLCILQAKAYTTENLVSDGWSLATSLDDITNNVYVFVDAGAQETAMVRGASQGIRSRYNTLCNPILNKQEVWVIEKYGDNYAILGIEDNYYFSSGSAGWDDSMTDGVDGNKGLFTFNLSGEKYDVRSVAVTGDNNYMGPWNNEGSVDLTGSRESHDGTEGDGMEDIAVNKASSSAPGYRLYKMSKRDYLLKYLQQYPNIEAPLNVSYFILNSKIYQRGANTSRPDGWSEDGCNSSVRTDGTGNTYLKGYDDSWTNKKVKIDYFQTISNLPRGQYKATVSIRDNKSKGKLKAYIYQNPNRKESNVATSSETDQTTTPALDIADGTGANIGVWTGGDNAGDATLAADNFRLQIDPYLSTMATAGFTSGSTLTAGLWYYFDIASSNEYDFTSSESITLSYATGDKVLSEASTETFTAGVKKALNLEAGRLYVKADVATTLTLTYRYNVGSATLSNADGSYTQNSTFSVTYPDAATNDPNASPALVASSKATVNGNEVALSSVTNGFSLDLGSLAANTDYVIAIPAGVYGYTGNSMNETITVTLHTPTVFDGEYVLYDAATEMFLGRGSGYGTEAVLDKYGVPFNLVTDATGTSSIEFVDWTGVYLFITGTSIYTDNASTGWTLNPVVGGYTLSNVAKTAYATHATGSFGEYVRTTDNSASATVWTLMTKSERDAIIAAYPAENKSNIIAASGISTTAGDFETFLSNNYNAVDCTSAIGTATFTDGSGDWTWTGSWREQDGQPKYGTNFVEAWNATGAWTQTVGKANLPAGIYKVTVQGFERRKANDAATALYAAGYNLVSTFLSANGEQVRFTDWNEVDGKPTDTSGAVTAFGSGEAVNTVYVYLDGNTDLNLMVRKPNYIWDCWIIMNNFTLTRYEQTEVTMKTSKAGSYGTFIAPFDVTIPSGVTASKVTGHVGNLLTLEDLTTTIPKNTPVVVYSEDAINETFKGKDGSNGLTSYSKGLLTGIYTAAAIAEGNYVLQTNGGVQGFYQVGASGLTGVPYRAYLNSSALGVKAFFFGNDADGIDSVQGLGFKVQDSEIFNLAGQKMSKLQKGVNIVNGKKILVK